MRLPARLLRSVPPGTLSVGAGVVTLGASAYAFLVLAGRGLGVERFAQLSVLWVLVFTVGPGLFVPLEQEVGRAVAARRARAEEPGPLVRLAARVAVGSAAAVTAALLLAAPVLVPQVFDGSRGLLAALVVAVWALCAAHLSRGVLAGTGRFGHYGAQLGVEGLLRVLACLALVLAGVTAVLAYGLLLGVATALAVAVTVSGLRGVRRAGPAASGRELSQNLGLLLAGSVLAQALINLGPVLVKVLSPPEDAGAAGQFLAGSVLTRVPLLLFASVQASLLPRLSALAAEGRSREFRSTLARIALLVGAAGGAGVVVSFAVGPELVRLLFGGGFELGRSELGLLALGAALYMVAVVLSQAHIALERHGTSTAGWAAGVAGLALATLLGSGVVERVVWAFVLGTATALVVLAVLLPRSQRAASVVAVDRPLTAPEAW